MVDWARLRAAATAALVHAYAPYSRYPVGAAGLTPDGEVLAAGNVENASIGLSLCAECGLVSMLRASGRDRFVAVACVDGDGRALAPCGRCRQVLWEHGGPDLLVDGTRLAELLPAHFGPEHLDRGGA
ncbi:MAG: cytidine deaminase [Acidimicrobiia bacterium]